MGHLAELNPNLFWIWIYSVLLGKQNWSTLSGMLILAQMLLFGENLLLHRCAFMGTVSPVYHLPLARCCKISWITVCRNSHCTIKTEDVWSQKVCKEASATIFPLLVIEGTRLFSTVSLLGISLRVVEVSLWWWCLRTGRADVDHVCSHLMSIVCWELLKGFAEGCYFGYYQHFYHFDRGQHPG